ncbi:MAG: COX15/CtaA family protein [Actinomycetes bacterium]
MSKTIAANRSTELMASRWLPRIAILCAITVYFLIIFGSHVRVTDSGMGCPDWPLCKGSLNPAQGFHAFMEQMHRYLAGIASILVALTALIAYRIKARREVLRPAIFTGFVVVIQIILGAVTVFAANWGPTVTAHLLAGLSLLGSATVAAVAALVPMVELSGSRLSILGWSAITAAGLLYISGSLIVNAEAEKYCAKFPLCPAGVPDRFAALHLIHRGMVVIASTALITFAIHAWKNWSSHPGARPLSMAIILLVVATATLGIVSALLKAPPHLADLHLAGAAAVLAVTTALATLGWLVGADSQEGAGR